MQMNGFQQQFVMSVVNLHELDQHANVSAFPTNSNLVVSYPVLPRHPLAAPRNSPCFCLDIVV